MGQRNSWRGDMKKILLGLTWSVGLLCASGCQVQWHLADSKVRLRGTYVTVDMRARGSGDRWLWNGPIQSLAQNKLCALEVIGNKMYLIFPDGSRLPLVARQVPGAASEPADEAAGAQFVLKIGGGRIDSGPIALRDAILSRNDCAPAASRLAAEWLAAGVLEFHGRSAARSLLTALTSERTIDFDARARLTPAGQAILRAALSADPTSPQDSR